MSETKIQWTDVTWNPVRGCSIVSPGCHNCYAMRTARRFDKPGGTYEGLTKPGPHGPQWSGALKLVDDKLDEPLHWRDPKMVFVNSMSDLFHEDVPDKFIRLVFGVMSLCGQHTFQILTKRSHRMREWFANKENRLTECQAEWTVHGGEHDPTLTPTGKSRVRDTSAINGTYGSRVGDGNYWPLPNVWLGVSCEDQQRADERIPDLLASPAAVRFLSCEPLLGPVDLSAVRFLHGNTENVLDIRVSDFARQSGIEKINGVDWVIVGGESGHGARQCDVAWIRSIVQQCNAAGVACFVKQLGAKIVIRNDRFSEWPRDGDGLLDLDAWPERQTFQGADAIVRTEDRKGGDPSEWPEDLRVREWPASVIVSVEKLT